tara:strand:+ start:213 stop:413 length:201 start_codon:yes stop_codon:yes gene_type:complete
MEENKNVIDFTAYKMRSIIEDLDKANRVDYATAVQEALDAYLLGHIRISFIDGWPYIIDNTNDINL